MTMVSRMSTDCWVGISMKTIAVGEFKARCLRLLEDVRSKREGLVITKRGVPIAEVLPLKRERKGAREELLGTVLFEKDIISPLDEVWGAAR